MPEVVKSPAQVRVDALNRKRKPLIKFDEKPAAEALKAKDGEISNLNRQLVLLQKDQTQKEAYIRELEDKIALLQQPPKIEPQQLTEDVPGTGQRRTRRAVVPAPVAQVEPHVIPKPEAPEAKPKPGDGIAEDD